MMFVCLSDATSEDGLLERVNNKLYTKEQAKAELRFNMDWIFLPVEEYNACVTKGLCR